MSTRREFIKQVTVAAGVGAAFMGFGLSPGKVLAAVAAKSEATRQLAYRLYTLCERAGWAEDARAYNEIITSWSAIESAAAEAPKAHQGELFG